MMEAGGDEEVADGQNIQSSNANVWPSESRDETLNGTCAYCILSFNIRFLSGITFLSFSVQHLQSTDVYSLKITH